MMEENKVVETASESYDDSGNIFVAKNPVAGKGDLTRNPEHTKQTV